MLPVRLRSSWAVFACLVVTFALLIAAGVRPTFAAADTVSAYRLPVATGRDAPFSLYAEERGRGDPVVLLHGLGGSTYSWRHIAPVLARTNKVIAIDLKGFGRSDKAFDTAYSAADQARLIVAFLQRRGLRNITLVGHSFGGNVALLVALQLQRTAPLLVRRLVLIDAPALPQPLTPTVMLLQQPVLPYVLLTLVPPDLTTRIALLPTPGQRLNRHYSQDDASAYARPFYDAAARHAYIQTARLIEPESLPQLLAAYGSIRQRTLLVWCTNDDVVPLSTGKALLGMLPRARLEQLDGCNHVPTDEAPQALAKVITRFLKPVANSQEATR